MAQDFIFKKGPISGPPYDFIFGLSDVEPCPPDWEEQSGVEIEVDATSCATLIPAKVWEDIDGDAIDFDATSEWEDVGGDAIDFDIADSYVFIPDWKDQSGIEIDVNVDCCDTGPEKQPVTLGVANAAHGETANADYSSRILFVPSAFEGGSLTVELKSLANITIPVNFEIGETLIPALWTEVLLAPNEFGIGEEFRFLGLNTYPSQYIVAYGYTGETGIAGLETNSVFAPLAQAGETFTGDISIYPSQDIVTQFETGETVSGTLVTTAMFGMGVTVGETLAGELTDEPYEGIMGVFEIGETVSGTLDIIPGFIPRGLHGETVNAEIATTLTFEANGYTGESGTVTFYQPVYWNPEPRAYAGEEMLSGFSVGTFSLGVIQGAAGNELTAILTTTGQTPMMLTAQSGETATVAISWAANIGDVRFSEGARAEVTTLAFDPLIYAYDGARAEADIATQMTMPGAAFEGPKVAIDLTTGPSQPLGILQGGHGEETTVQTLALLKAIHLGVTFYNSYVFNAGLPYLGPFMDLDTQCCYPYDGKSQEPLNIEMNHAEYGDQKFDGDKIRFTMDLQAQHRFKFNFVTGETARGVEDNTFVFAVNMATGEHAGTFTESNDINFPLCPVNFIPDGDNVYVELDFTDDTTCSSDYAYAGETAVVGSLQAFPNFQPAMFTGERMEVALVYTPLWGVHFPMGEEVKTPLELSFNFGHGESVRGTFYIDPILGAHGETMYASLTTIYEVLFLEDGCLDNEYIWTDENGDPIPEKFNPVPVELDPFQHDIKAKCQ